MSYLLDNNKQGYSIQEQFGSIDDLVQCIKKQIKNHHFQNEDKIYFEHAPNTLANQFQRNLYSTYHIDGVGTSKIFMTIIVKPQLLLHTKGFIYLQKMNKQMLLQCKIKIDQFCNNDKFHSLYYTQNKEIHIIPRSDFSKININYKGLTKNILKTFQKTFQIIDIIQNFVKNKKNIPINTTPKRNKNSPNKNSILNPINLEEEQQREKQNIYQLNNETVNMMKSMSVMPKEYINIANLYYSQRKGQTFIKNLSKVQKKSNQIFREINIDQSTAQRKPLSQMINKDYLGAFSQMTFIQAYVQVTETCFNLRYHTQKQDEMQQKDHFRLRKTTLMQLVKKQCIKPQGKLNFESQQQKVKYYKHLEGSRKSLQNEINFVKYMGGTKNTFICNYYSYNDPVQKKVNPKNPPGNIKKIIQQIKLQTLNKTPTIYADYHAVNGLLFLFQKPFIKITMYDILNFMQQIVQCLLSFYLDNGFIHRDIKLLNIMINLKQGIIQVIDQGSIMYLKQKQQSSFQRFKQKLDPTLRSTHFVHLKEFNENQFLRKKYKNDYKKYKVQSSKHKNFDVYSLGIVLKNIIQEYFRKSQFQTMEGYNIWKQLIDSMIKQDQQTRIRMQQVQLKLKQIEKIIYPAQLFTGK